ncbi:MAG: enoyl-CoA hydratase-related protein, partial [Candidatus Bathyarchaeota archaeon]|nr:enoyl-CoA hydratase-related protein [Candidatus Bathyarchaeota archaeon]
ARVNGAVAGGGWEFVACCDLAIAADHARFISPGPRVGMTSIGGLSQWLPLHMSIKKSAEMVLLSSQINAEEALKYGVVNDVVPLDKLDDKVREYIDKMKKLSPSSLWYYKVHHNWWKELIWRPTWEHGKAWFALNIGSMEPSEGLWAFKEKRKAEMEKIRTFIAEGGDPRVPYGPYIGKCSKCGAEYLPGDSKYCLKCGAKL